MDGLGVRVLRFRALGLRVHGFCGLFCKLGKSDFIGLRILLRLILLEAVALGMTVLLPRTTAANDRRRTA